MPVELCESPEDSVAIEPIVSPRDLGPDAEGTSFSRTDCAFAIHHQPRGSGTECLAPMLTVAIEEDQ